MLIRYLVNEIFGYINDDKIRVIFLQLNNYRSLLQK